MTMPKTNGQLYKALFENMLNGFAHCQACYDDDGNLVDWIYLNTNAAFEKQTGLSGVDGQMVSEVIPNLRETNPDLFKIYERISKRAGSFERFEQYLSALEMWFDVSVYCVEPGTFTAVFDNITAQKYILMRLEETNQQIKDAYDETVRGWAKAIEMRSRDVQGHSLRVADITMSLLLAMSYYREDIGKVKFGALLHDVGKLAIPDSILLKSDKLTEEEMEVMKQHPLYACDFLSGISYLRDVLDIPYCHHERWNGSGYPRGLMGAEIPFEARAFAVVDVYDALISERPYRKALDKEEALDYIRSERGKSFDPTVVDRFMEVVGQT